VTQFDNPKFIKKARKPHAFQMVNSVTVSLIAADCRFIANEEAFGTDDALLFNIQL
jgi:hypothetical protein